jgi:uncharacterized membrane protein YsdA (DUF1294 family)/cold shock CspA family protein
MVKGRIVDWKADRGFGFARPVDGGNDVFMHISEIRHIEYEPKIGDEVTFKLKFDPRGRPRATAVKIAGAPKSKQAWIILIVALIPAVFFATLYHARDYRLALFAYVGMSAVTFVIYGSDKLRAGSGGWRTSEATLHWMEFLGGWPGAIMAQLLFRHKIAKPSFQLVFWAIVGAHICLWMYLSAAGMTLADTLNYGLQVVKSIRR